MKDRRTRESNYHLVDIVGRDLEDFLRQKLDRCHNRVGDRQGQGQSKGEPEQTSH